MAEFIRRVRELPDASPLLAAYGLDRYKGKTLSDRRAMRASDINRGLDTVENYENAAIEELATVLIVKPLTDQRVDWLHTQGTANSKHVIRATTTWPHPVDPSIGSSASRSWDVSEHVNPNLQHRGLPMLGWLVKPGLLMNTLRISVEFLEEPKEVWSMVAKEPWGMTCAHGRWDLKPDDKGVFTGSWQTPEALRTYLVCWRF